MVACGCLLLPMASCFLLLSPVLVLLFAVSGTSAYGRASAVPTSAPIMPGLRHSSTPGDGQAADSPAAMPDEGALPLSADSANGKLLFNTFQPAAGIACATCHRVDSEERLVGPGLLNAGKRADWNQDGRLTHRGIDPNSPKRVVTYLRAAIINPSGYTIPGYADLMPKNWGKVFSDQQIDDLIAYLLTLKGG